MAQYRKKPVVIEAIQWDGTFEGMQKIKEAFPKLETLSLMCHEAKNWVGNWRINTLEDGHKVSDGDFIIQGVKGEFYPCKSDIFSMTYEAVLPRPPQQLPTGRQDVIRGQNGEG